VNKPLVSICIPTYNGATYIAEAMDSAIAQTYPNLEIVVSDDASTDDTLKVIEAYRSKTNVPIHIYHHKPQGIGANWNHCIQHAKGVYIKFLFQDDVLEPTCIARMVAMTETSENIGLVYCRRSILYDKTKHFDKRWVQNFNILHQSWHKINIEEGVLLGRQYLKDKHLMRHPVNKIGEPTATLINKDCFKKVGVFSEVLDQALDIEFWYRLMPYYNFGFIDQPLVKFRLHSNQASQVNAKIGVKNREKKLLENVMFKEYFWYLHPSVKIDLVKSLLNFEKVNRFFRKIKSKLHSWYK
jgi:glycosyltransferase involved in cell wall biosynthesis